MSKNKGKQKKGNDQGHNLEAIAEQQKRQILEQTFTIKKLQDRISCMTQQNYDIVTKHQSMQKKYQQKIDNQRIYLENYQNSVQTLNRKVQSLQILKLQQQTTIKTIQNHLDFQIGSRQKEMQEYKKLVSTEMLTLENQLKQYNHYMGQRDEVFDQRNQLRKQLQGEQELKMLELADKEREKVQITDKLKDEMLTQITDMKKKLLSLKKEQLSTTTRLAVLQNHQLTGQLQFQSKQTEKLLFQNQKLQKKVTNLQKDVDIHKEVEEQLAKRSHLSRGIIKKLTNKIAELEQEIKKQKKSISEETPLSPKKSNSNFSGGRKDSDIEKQEEIISILDKNLEEKQKKYLKLKTDYLKMDNENQHLKGKIREIQKKSNELSVMLIKYYEDVLNGNIELKVNESDQYALDIKGFKKKPVEEWNTEDCRLIVNVLLNQLKNNINRYNLGVPTINKSQLLLINDDQIETKLPTIGISEHSLIKKEPKKLKEIQGSLAPKLVGNFQWGRTVHSNSVSNLTKKYKH